MFPRGLRSKLQRKIRTLRLRASEAVLPSGYFAQLVPVYADAKTWKAETSDYHRLHDWPDVRDGNRVLQAQLLLDSVRSLPQGDYAELGTYRGNYGRMIYGRMAQSSSFYCFDTFEGFHADDVAADATVAGVNNSVGHFDDTSMELVRTNICGNSASDRLTFRKGFFPDTFTGLEDRCWRFVLLDADLYAPIKAGLEIFWPRMVAGGMILVHDYLSLHFKGSRLAVDEFCGPREIIPAVWPDRVGTAILTKPLQ